MKYFLLFVFLVLMLFPGFQKKFTPLKEIPLKGAFKLHKTDSLTTNTWFSGRFQQSYTAAVNDAMGFRTTLIRLYNQINFNAFNLASGGIVVGKSGYLFGKAYIETYNGKDKMKYGDLWKTIRCAYRLQNYLENIGIHFIVVFAPSKARIYPEYLPSRYLSKKKSLTNYDEYIQIIGKQYPDLHFFDVNAFFCKLKKTIAIPLYSQGGTHWTNYTLKKYFLDSLVHYMGSLRGIKFPVMRERNIHWSNDQQSPDDDLRQLMNLFSSNKHEKLPYADFSFVEDPDGKKPGLLMISDSYYSMLYDSKDFNGLLSRNDFWYYNKIRYPEGFYQGKKDPAFLRDDLLQHDFVILMATETNITDLFSFPETALTLLGVGAKDINWKEEKRQERIGYYIKAIYKNPDWLNNIKEQVQTKHKALEDLVRINAEYMEMQEHHRKRD